MRRCPMRRFACKACCAQLGRLLSCARRRTPLAIDRYGGSGVTVGGIEVRDISWMVPQVGCSAADAVAHLQIGAKMRKQSSEQQPRDPAPSQSPERCTYRANPIAIKHDPDSTLIDWIDEQGRRQPEAAALIGAGDSLSYAALAARTTQLAATLLAAGVARQDRVGVLLEPGADLVASLLAIMRIGAIYVPLHP